MERQHNLSEYVDEHLGLWIYDINTQAETWSHGLETLLGTGPRSGRGLLHVLPELRDRLNGILQERRDSAHFHLALPDATCLLVCDLKVRRLENGAPGIVSAEIRREDSPQASMGGTVRNILEAFSQAPGAVVFMTDAEGRYTLLAGSGLPYLGIVPEQWLGRSIFEFLKDHADHTRMIERIFRGDRCFDQSRFGEYYFEDRIFPILGQKNEILGIAGIQINVTDRVKARQELQASTDLLNNLFDSIPDNAYVLDLDYNIVHVNASARQMFPEVSLIGTPCFQAIHGRKEPCAFCPVVESFETGQPAFREYREEKVNGYFELTSFPVRDRETGQIIGATEFARDITDRKRMEESLLRNQALLDDLLAILDHGVYLIDTNYTITRANKAMEKMYPHLLPLVGRKCYETTIYGRVCPDCAAECMFHTGKAATRTFFEKNSEDEPGFWLELTAFPLYEFGSEHVNGAICIVRDVTPRIEMEGQLDDYRRQIQIMAEKQMHELRLSEARLRSILETCGAAISFADSQGRYTYVNGKFKEMFGYSQEEMLGKSVTGLLGSDHAKREEAATLVKQALDGEIDSFRETYELVAKEGRALWGDVSVSMVRGIEAEQTQFISVILDVTAQRLLLEHLDKARIAAEEASRAKSEFLAHMSHEIRTPLNGVIGLTELLTATMLDERQEEYVRMAENSAKSLLSLINDILDFSKIEADKLELDPTDFDLFGLVESARSIVAARAVEAGLELCASYSTGTPRYVCGDEGRLRQVLLNLVGNAIKFTENGGVEIRTETEPLPDGKVRILCSIRDSGIGMSRATQERLFQPFSQGDSSTSRKYGGTGLGLAISRHLIRLMGGDLNIESVPERGSTFSFEFTLPAARPDYLAEQVKIRAKSLDYLHKLAGTRTLLVDDNTIQRNALAWQFENWRMNVTAAASKAEALGHLEKSAPGKPDAGAFQLILVDATVYSEPDKPELQCGLELVETIRRLPDYRDTPIILLVPFNSTYDLETIRQNTGIVTLNKPVFITTLIETVIAALFPDSRFKFDVPSLAGATPEPRHEKPGDLRVLVAEDNKVNQIVIREMLSSHGYHCDIVENGREAVEATTKHDYDLVLMDCQMPEVDGYEATRMIRRRENTATGPDGKKRLTIIALTAHAAPHDQEKCLQAGMDSYCTKPIDQKRLFEIIRSSFGSGE